MHSGIIKGLPVMWNIFVSTSKRPLHPLQLQRLQLVLTRGFNGMQVYRIVVHFESLSVYFGEPEFSSTVPEMVRELPRK